MNSLFKIGDIVSFNFKGPVLRVEKQNGETIKKELLQDQNIYKYQLIVKDVRYDDCVGCEYETQEGQEFSYFFNRNLKLISSSQKVHSINEDEVIALLKE